MAETSKAIRRQLWRIRLAFDLWRCEGYDGKPVTLREAWQWAGCPYPWRTPQWWQERAASANGGSR